MTVSIVIAAYNAAATIAETLDSVCAQTYSDWDVIVVDDGSTDRTAEVAKEYTARDARIRLVRQPNGGESSARNAGLQMCRGEWLLFLDADDWISPQHLQRMTDELRSNPALDAVHCGYVRVAADGTEVPDEYQPPTGDMFATLARRAAFPVHACVVRKSVVDAVGAFDTSLRKSPDWDLWQRVARTGAQFGAVREVLAYYRMQPASASLDSRPMFEDGLRVLHRGHAPDPRVKKPHPAHANGTTQEGMECQEFYLLCWCAGLMIGRNQSALGLFDLIPDSRCVELYPPAIARCIFESATLPSCGTAEDWEALWTTVRARVDEFLPVLEAHSQTPSMAERARVELMGLILRSSPTWKSVMTAIDQQHAILARETAVLAADLEAHRVRAAEGDRQRAEFEERSAGLTAERENWRRRAEETAADRARWQQLAETKTKWLADIDGQLWVRVGRRLRLAEDPARGEAGARS